MAIEQQEMIRVLHVDDDLNFADMAAEFLKRENKRFNVRTAGSAKDGKQLLANGNVDCVVSDYEMPGMDGIEFLVSVREEYPDLPFLLFTGKGSEEVASKAISNGVTDYLQKRTDTSQFELLANRINNAVEQQRAQRVVTKTEQRFQTIADQANDIFWIFDASFDELFFVNSTFEEIWGQSVESIEERPRSLLNGVHPEDRSRVSDAMDRVTAGESVDVEFRVNPNKDYSRWVWVNGSPVRNEAGEITTIVGFARDITERKDRERELERMNDLFEQAQEIADLGAWETDLRNDEGWWTEQVNDIYGLPSAYEPDPGEGIEYFHPEDQPVIRDAFEGAKEAGEPYDLELRVEDDEEGFKWIRTRGKPQVEDDKVVRVRGTIQDITDSKARQIELERANTLLSTLVDTLPQGVLAEDNSRNVLATNERMFDLFDLPGNPEEVIGADCEQLATKVSDQFVVQEEFVSRINHIVSKREPIDAEELELVDGRTFERSYRPIELPDGEGNLWVYTDITERKKQQQELETILERLELAVEGANLGIWDWDMQTDEVERDELLTKMLGYTPEEMGGHLNDWERLVHPEGKTRHNKALAEHIENQTSHYQCEYRLKTATEDWKWVRTIGKVVERDKNGDPVRAVGIHLDINDRKERIRQIQMIDRVLQHNFNNNISVIKGYAETIEDATTGEIASYSGNILKSGQKLLQTVEKEHDVTKFLSDRPEMTTLDIGSEVEVLILEMREAYPNAEIVPEIQSGTTVRAVPEITQAVEEVLQNAIIHSDSDSPRIQVQVDSGEDTLWISISDNNPHIPEMERKVLLEGEEMSPLYHGSGIGLWFVYLTVTHSDGRVEVQATEPEGNEVTIRLPHPK